jgi:hypothetical protein
MTRPERIENTIQLLILLLIGGMAGAASFTHVHDWTMHNAPAGTGGWFGWANAVISELTPTAAGLEIRRRKRAHRPIAYPMAVLIAAAALSLSAQVAQAKPGITGWLLAAVPALAFLALSKLVLSRTTTHPEADRPYAAAETPIAPSARTAENPASVPAVALAAAPPATDHPDELSSQLLTSARMAAFAHHQATGQPITADGLAAHLDIPHTLAGILIHALDGTGIPGIPPSPVTAVNGTRETGSRP